MFCLLIDILSLLSEQRKSEGSRTVLRMDKSGMNPFLFAVDESDDIPTDLEKKKLY